MRVIAFVVLASIAHAQAPVRAAMAPAAPGSYVETSLEGHWTSSDGIEGGAIGARSRGAYLLTPAFEIGGGWGWRAHWLSGGGGLGSFARTGIEPWGLWVKTGGTWPGGGAGIGTYVTMGPRLIANDIDVSSEAWSLAIRASFAHAWPGLEVGLEADIGAYWRVWPSLAGGGALSLVLGDANAPARPLAILEARASHDLGFGARASLGAWIAIGRGIGLRVAAYSTLPNDPEGLRIGLEVTCLIWRERG